MDTRRHPHLAKHCIYRHMSFTDVDMVIQVVQYVGPKVVKLKVTWVLQRDHNFVLCNDKVQIKRSDLWKWKRVA